MDLHGLNQLSNDLAGSAPMPVLFVGHGSPMNAIEDNPFSREWQETALHLPRPKAILCISAHWETWGTLVTGMEMPRTIHDFGGFPRALFAVRYGAPGSPWLAQETQSAVQKAAVKMDDEWGLDHGCWSVLKRMYPLADVPVVQMSLDYSKPALYHLELAKELAGLRRKGVLVVGSGNMVHNLRQVVIKSGDVSDFNRPFGLDWALEANALFKKLIDAHRFDELANYQALGTAAQLAVPTPEHFLPMLYALALKEDRDELTYFNDQAVGGSLTMTSFVIGN